VGRLLSNLAGNELVYFLLRLPLVVVDVLVRPDPGALQHLLTTRQPIIYKDNKYGNVRYLKKPGLLPSG
jgi:hypothetical protein